MYITLTNLQGPAIHYEQWSIFPMELRNQHRPNSRTHYGTFEIYKFCLFYNFLSVATFRLDERDRGGGVVEGIAP